MNVALVVIGIILLFITIYLDAIFEQIFKEIKGYYWIDVGIILIILFGISIVLIVVGASEI